MRHPEVTHPHNPELELLGRYHRMPRLIEHITCPDYEILLVDNGSTDGAVECFRKKMIGITRNQIEPGYTLYNNTV